MTKNKLTQERLEAIRTNAERIAGGGLITDINEMPSIGRMASVDVPALLAEIERLRGINVLISDPVLWGVSCSECSNQLAENWEIIGGAFICTECTEEMEEVRNDREEA